jgi:hypothetical protein
MLAKHYLKKQQRGTIKTLHAATVLQRRNMYVKLKGRGPLALPVIKKSLTVKQAVQGVAKFGVRTSTRNTVRFRHESMFLEKQIKRRTEFYDAYNY